MTQLALTEPFPRLCEWCGQQPATRRIIATDACEDCVQGGTKHRVRVSLDRWKVPR